MDDDNLLHELTDTCNREGGLMFSQHSRLLERMSRGWSTLKDAKKIIYISCVPALWWPLLVGQIFIPGIFLSQSAPFLKHPKVL